MAAVINTGSAVIVMAASLCVAAIGSAWAAPKVSEKELTLAKHYVLAGCIFDRYPNTALANEADAWAAALVEDGSLPAEAYLALTKLAKSAPVPKATQNGVVMRLENCVDFVESSAVVAKIKHIVRR